MASQSHTGRNTDRSVSSGWELYHVAEDPAECHNLAEKHPEKLRELVSLWWAEAGKYKVLPIDGSVFERSVAERPQLTQERSQYVFYPDLSVVPMGTAPKVFNRPHSITADVTIPDGGAEGVLLAQGGVAGGFVLYVKDGKLHYVSQLPRAARVQSHVHKGRSQGAGQASLRRADRQA